MKKLLPLLTLGAIAFGPSTTTRAAPIFDWIDIDGQFTLLAAGGASISSDLNLTTIGQSANPTFSTTHFATASFSDNQANGSFAADAPDALVAVNLNHTFTPTADGSVELAWDFTGLTPTEASVSTGLFDLTNNVLVFEQDLGLTATTGFESFPVLGTNEYVWSFDGVISRPNEGFASASITLVPEPASGALIILGALVTTRRKR